MLFLQMLTELLKVAVYLLRALEVILRLLGMQ
ncbi:protein of unknown function (plasmid) [Cupriavidus taiwanensis]|jgi:hypothetical protein|nr:hypothetical protein CBM2598_U20021 [Cupriavidus taiwanensis]SPD37887.1 protein of unknown function [Cupriavidus taiwanensis]